MSNIVETPAIKIKQTIAENLTLQQVACPAPPCSTPLGTPPFTPTGSSTPPQSPGKSSASGRMQRSNSACISNSELALPPRYNNKIINKRRNTQLLGTQMIQEQRDASNSEKIHLQQRLQTLRTITASSQKSKNLLNRGLSKEFKESFDEDEEKLREQTKELNGLKENELNNLESNKLTDNLNRIKLSEQSNSNFINQNRTGSVSKVSNDKFKTLEEIKENDYQNGHRVRSIKSNHELDEFIKENTKNSNDKNTAQNDVQKIIETAQIRKNELLLLLKEHEEIVKKIKLAETTK